MLRVLFDFSVYITIRVHNNSTLQCVYLKKKKKKSPRLSSPILSQFSSILLEKKLSAGRWLYELQTCSH